MEVEIISHNLKDTENLAHIIAKNLFKGAVIALNGDLGAGKTTFTQYIGKYLGIKDKINSPTFNILKCYFNGKFPLYHIDAYRLEDIVNADVGLDEVIQGDGICVIEWPEFIENLVVEPLEIRIEFVNSRARKFLFTSSCEKYSKIFASLRELI